MKNRAIYGIIIFGTLAGCTHTPVVTAQQRAEDYCFTRLGENTSGHFSNCVAQRRVIMAQQQDVAQRQAGMAMMAIGLGMMASQPEPPKEHVCIMPNNTTYYRC